LRISRRERNCYRVLVNHDLRLRIPASEEFREGSHVLNRHLVIGFV